MGSAASGTSASSGEGGCGKARAGPIRRSESRDRAARETRGRQGAMADAPGGGPGPSWRITYRDQFDHLGLGNLELGESGECSAIRPPVPDADGYEQPKGAVPFGDTNLGREPRVDKLSAKRLG